MAVYLKPTREDNDPKHSTVAVDATELPGVEGINMSMLVGAMIVGAGMWLGILHIGNILLQTITG